MADLAQYYPGLAAACQRAYRLSIDAVKDAAKLHGYAVAVHGSLSRDIDLVAIPWTEGASSAEDLVSAIRVAAETSTGVAFINPRDSGPTAKPHGRLCWSIHLGSGPYIDLSVLPRTK